MNLNEGKFIHVDINKEMKKCYIDYAMSVIVGRALPDVHDAEVVARFSSAFYIL